MNHYTDTIPVALAEKLKEKGMPLSYVWMPNGQAARIEDQLIPYCTYAEVFDWLLSDKKLDIKVNPYINELGILVYFPTVKVIGCGNIATYFVDLCPTWHEAANAAIEKALEMI